MNTEENKLSSAGTTQTEPDNFPNNLPECFALLRQWEPCTRYCEHDRQPEKRAKFQWVKRLKKHVFEMQNGQPQKPFDHMANSLRRGKAIFTGYDNRKRMTAAMKSAIENNFDGEPIFPTKDIAPELENFLESSFETVLKIKLAIAKYSIERFESFIYFNPQTRQEEIKAALLNNPTHEQVQQFLAETSIIESTHFKTISSSKKSQVSKLFNETVRPLLVQLIEDARQYVSRCKESAINYEKGCFEFAEVAYEPTAISRRYDKTLTALNHAASNISEPNEYGVDTTLLFTVFGVELFASDAGIAKAQDSAEVNE